MRSWRTGRSSRRRSSAPVSACRPRRPRSSSTTATMSCSSTTARRSPAASVVIATGVRYRRLHVPRIEEFEGVERLLRRHHDRGAACAAAIRWRSSAAATRPGRRRCSCAQYSRTVHLLVREADLGENMSRYLVGPHRAHSAVQVHLHTEVRELVGDGVLEGLVVEDNQTGERQRSRGADAVRVHRRRASRGLAGGRGGAGRARFRPHRGGCGSPYGTRDASGSRSRPLFLETSRPGVFAAGDVRSGSIKRMASAVGEGSMAVRLVHEHLKGRGRLDRPAQAGGP